MWIVRSRGGTGAPTTSSLNWRFVGPAYWPDYQSSMQQTVAVTSVSDTVVTAGGSFPGGSLAFRSSVLLADGRVFCIPYNSTSARIYNPLTNTTTTPSPVFPGSAAFWGGVLMRDGRVFLVPYNRTTAAIYDPVADTLTTPTGTYGAAQQIGGTLLPDGRVFVGTFGGARLYDPVTDTVTIGSNFRDYSTAGPALLPDGTIICPSAGSPTLRIYNYVTNTLTTVASLGGTNAYFRGAVNMLDGRMYVVPSQSQQTALIYNYLNGTTTTATGTVAPAGSGGVLLPNGKVFITPNTANAKAQIYDPVADTLTQTAATITGTQGQSVVMLDGRLFLTPVSSTTALIFGGGGGFDSNVHLSAYMNKY